MLAGPVTSYRWEFGEAATPSHLETMEPEAAVTLQTPGLHTVVFSAINAAGESEPVSQVYEVSGPNAPILQDVWIRSRVGQAGTSITFEAAALGEVERWGWRVEILGSGGRYSTSSFDPSFTYRSTRPGEHLLRVWAFNDDGASAERALTFDVPPPALPAWHESPVDSDFRSAVDALERDGVLWVAYGDGYGITVARCRSAAPTGSGFWSRQRVVSPRLSVGTFDLFNTGTRLALLDSDRERGTGLYLEPAVQGGTWEQLLVTPEQWFDPRGTHDGSQVHLFGTTASGWQLMHSYGPLPPAEHGSLDYVWDAPPLLTDIAPSFDGSMLILACNDYHTRNALFFGSASTTPQASNDWMGHAVGEGRGTVRGLFPLPGHLMLCTNEYIGLAKGASPKSQEDWFFYEADPSADVRAVGM
ncbi:MAG TPA: PKD domain-containing protein, partial [bacterium]|nr:PKD domain-containing protein [bacterium]